MLKEMKKQNTKLFITSVVLPSNYEKFSTIHIKALEKLTDA